MAFLDAPAFKPVLTPEAALGIVQKEVQRRGWRKYDVSAIRLVYTPYYTFSFDVLAEGAGQPSAKAALNASTGELNDFVPFLMERPLERVRESEEKAEVEATSISAPEVRDVAAVKVASTAGVKKESVSISAVSKVYVAAYRVWVNVADDTYKVEIDAALGAPRGLESIPAREKTPGEVTEETLGKMKTPSGWFELLSAVFRTVPEVLSGKGPGGPVGRLLGTPAGRVILLVALVLVLAYFAFLQPRTATTCEAAAGYPRVLRGTMWLNGTCEVHNPGGQEEVVTLAVFAQEDGRETGFRTIVSQAVKGGATSTRPFALSWNASLAQPGAIYTVGHRRLG
jgi:hypothetical protein